MVTRSRFILLPRKLAGPALNVSHAAEAVISHERSLYGCFSSPLLSNLLYQRSNITSILLTGVSLLAMFIAMLITALISWLSLALVARFPYRI
ncbi:hypothetical protein QL285_085381 [Trifolium repens]|nr:hypothetical protein QL285_085381 [Trifolium repens]